MASPAALSQQRRYALAVVSIPFLGTLLALLLAFVQGVGFVEIGTFIGMFLACTIGTNVGLHRHFAHNAFEAKPWVRVGLAVLGSMAGQGPVVRWVASHRRHHAYSDESGDPHSPNLHGEGLGGRLRGLWYAHIGWLFAEVQTDWVYFGRDIMQNRALFKVHQHYFVWVFLGFAIPAALGGALSGTWVGVANGFLWGGLVRMFVVNHGAWCVGSICHVFGRRPFDTRDGSANNYWVAVLTLGEGLQNNHHAFPNSAAHGLRWWEPDLAMRFIRWFEWMGWVWNVRVPSTQAILAARKA